MDLCDRLWELIAANYKAPLLEFLRQLREEGPVLEEGAFYRIYSAERKRLLAKVVVRFEGVAGGLAQFGFGQSNVRLLDGRKQRVYFAACRLKL